MAGGPFSIQSRESGNLIFQLIFRIPPSWHQTPDFNLNSLLPSSSTLSHHPLCRMQGVPCFGLGNRVILTSLHVDEVQVCLMNAGMNGFFNIFTLYIVYSCILVQSGRRFWAYLKVAPSASLAWLLLT